jgi:uncharacterized protein (TIGR03435 family)
MRRVALVVFLVFGVARVYAQRVAFEVASVKPNNSGSGSSSTHTSRGEIKMENVSLKMWIEQAYNVKDYSLSGPAWLDGDRFDVIGKLPAGAKAAQIKLMLQSLLVERFKLAFHQETKMLPAYALVVDKKGAKIEALAGEGDSSTSSGSGRLAGTRVSMADFAELLSTNIDRPVQDLTGLGGVYNLKVTWTEDNRAVPPEGAEAATGPSLFSALQEQLGLKLEGRKLPVPIMVIDHIERTALEN